MPMPTMTNFGGHPCVPNTAPKAPSKHRCLRCGATTDWDTTTCRPGMLVHLPDASARADDRRRWLRLGYNVQPPQAGHCNFAACTDCYDPDLDLSLQPVFVPAQMPGEGFTRLTAASPSGDHVFHDGCVATVLWTLDWPPYTHPGYAPGTPNDWWARQVVTTHGSAWYGHAPDTRHTGPRLPARGVSFTHGSEEPVYRIGTTKTVARLPQLPATGNAMTFDIDPQEPT